MGLAQRMSRLRRLLDIRLGPGAAVLPRNVHRVQLDISNKATNGHLAGRRVWREYLPRLKYHNPRVPMVVNRSEDVSSPSVLTLTFENGQEEKIDMKHRSESEILGQLMALTKATPVKATSDEEAELERIAEQLVKSEEHRVQARIELEEKKREEALIAQARAALDDAKAAE